ncbi:MAG: hypothetical protein KJO91_08140 [Gammaproteobacteria bacterium]|nr:hypothetical protein [Gammaproteobacteria bacterium]
METAGINWQKIYSIDKGAGYRWQITSLNLQLFRYPKQWLICWHSDLANESREVIVEALGIDAEPQNDFQHEHYMVKTTTTKARLTPRTADRPVVVRPRDPFILPSHEEATLFVSTPLWIEIAVDDPSKVLKEMPVRRPSDTWFGPSLLTGDLCYDSRTRGVMDLQQLEYQPNRVITPLLIRNLAETPLTLERVSLPVPLLSVYEADDKTLWTESVSLTREEDGEIAALKISEGQPQQARRAKKITEPRHKADKNTFVRAFGGLFS